MKLIKLSTDHYIVVDNSEIKEGDYYLFTWGGEQEIQIFSNEQYADRENHNHLYTNACNKITHSTQPLEQINFVDEAEGLIMPKVNSISLQEVKELTGEVDVEKKLSEVFKKHGHSFEIAIPEFKKDLILLYNQCLEDNKDRKYTEEDIRKAWNAAYIDAMSIDEKTYKPLFFEDFIQSLQPKSEWNIEIVDGKLKLKQ